MTDLGALGDVGFSFRVKTAPCDFLGQSRLLWRRLFSASSRHLSAPLAYASHWTSSAKDTERYRVSEFGLENAYRMTTSFRASHVPCHMFVVAARAPFHAADNPNALAHVPL